MPVGGIALLFFSNFGRVRKVQRLKKILITLGLLTFMIGGYFLTDDQVVVEDGLIVGLECNYAPFNWTQLDDSNGAVKISNAFGYCGGYDVEIAKQIADDLGKELVIKKITDFDTLPLLVNNGTIDLIIAGMSPTEQRREVIAFSDEYYYSDLVLVVKADSSLAKANDLSDFRGAKVAAQLGTLHNELIKQIPSVNHSTPLSDFPTLTVAVKTGAIEAMVAEKPVAMAIVASNPDLTYVEFEEGHGFNLMGDDQTSLMVTIGLHKEEENLLTAVNKSLETLSSEERDQLMEVAISNQPASEE